MSRTRTLILGTAVAAFGLTAGVAVSEVADAPRNELPPNAALSRADVTPVPASRRVSATAPDPGGRLPWGLELSRSEAGGVCQAVNSVHDGRLVVMDGAGRPTPRKAPEAQNCTRFRADAGPREHVDLGAVAQHGVVVFHGVVDDRVRDITIVTPEGAQETVTLNRDRAFIVTFPGEPKDPPLYEVRVTLDDGSIVTYF